MNERIKKLRKELGLTQQEFADKIGSVQNTITGYETGRRMPSNQVITLIAREFNINESWLRSGEGEMFAPVNRDEEIAAFLGRVLGGDSSFKRRFVHVLARLDEQEWEVLERMARAMADEKKED